MESILITGGCGYIGSHTSLTFLQNNYKIIILDSNINSSSFVIDQLKKLGIKENFDFEEKITFYKGDIRDKSLVRKIFADANNNNEVIRSVIHFAGLKSVAESVINPILYWDNNFIGALNLFSVMEEYKCRSIVFSSSATIYGKNNGELLNENYFLLPSNPYGETKLSIEKLLSNLFVSSKKEWRIANLRYFNPIGAHPSGMIGENPIQIPNNLFPYICKVAAGKLNKLNIFGSDWPTRDGTCIRDYIHVMDLAEAHYSAFNFLNNKDPQIINLNIGTGLGTSVLELVNIFMKINNCDVPYVFEKRRHGDVPFLIANNKLAISKLNWTPKKSLSEMCKDGWEWQKRNPYGYS